MSKRDVSLASPDSKNDVIQHNADLPLTHEQRVFAEIVGLEIARLWKDRHDALPRNWLAEDPRPGLEDAVGGSSCPAAGMS
jgi:hypothetical protein